MRSNELDTDLFVHPGNIVRMGMAPVRIKVLNEIDGVEFKDCFARRSSVEIDGVEVNLISLADLRTHKLASGRHKDLDDIVPVEVARVDHGTEAVTVVHT